MTKTEKKQEKQESGNKRFILFIGNLPYDAGKDELRAHFKTAEPIKSVRLLTDRKTGKPKGFAFIEFDNGDALQKALAFHHSQFHGRRINVEMTAGGGGKSESRKRKLKEKNESLQQERAKMHAERQQQHQGAESSSKKQPETEGKEQTAPKKRQRVTGANAIQVGR